DPFVIVWTGPTTIPTNEQNPTGLAEGNYKAVITDAGGCSITKDITVTGGSGGTVSFGSVDIATPVTCNNKCDAVVSGSIATGTAPFMVSVSGGSNTKTVTVNALGSFSINEICPGSLVFT